MSVSQQLPCARGVTSRSPRAGFKRSRSWLNVALLAACRKRAWAQAIHLFRAMNTAKVQADVIDFSAAISAYATAGKWQHALLLLLLMSEVTVQPNIVSLTVCIRSLQHCKERSLQRALQLVNAATAWAERDAVSINAMLSLCGKDGQWQQALCLFGGLSNSQLEVSAVSFNTSITSCRSLYWQQASRLLAAMQLYSVQREVISFNAASSCGRTKWPLATQYFADMRQAQVQQSLISCSNVLEALRLDGEWQQGLHFFALMPARHVQPSAVSYQWVLGLCDAYRWQQSVQCLATMVWASVQANVLHTSSVTARFGDKRWRQALQRFCLAHRLRQDVFSFSSRISACGSRWGRGVQLLVALLQDSIKCNSVSFNAVIDACAKVGQWQHAMHVLGSMPLAGVPQDDVSYSVASASCNRAIGLNRGLAS